MADIARNVVDGIHVASCGGVWVTLVHGFAGLRETADELCFRPRLPTRWSGMRFRLLWRGQYLEVAMEPEATTYRLLEGPGLHLVHEDQKVLVTRAAPVTLPHRV